MTESDILKALAAKHAGEPFFGGVKNGPTWGARGLVVLDAVALKPSWASPCITGYEIKVSKSDFKADEKWPAYLDLCHRFYFACPTGMIKPSELGDPRIGLVYVSAVGKCYTRVKAAFRNIELPTAMLYYLVIYRTQKDEEGTPIDLRERRMGVIRDFLAGKADARTLGYQLSTALPKRLAAAEYDVERLARTAKEGQDALESVGIHSCWQLRETVRELRGRVNGANPAVVENALRAAEHAREIIGRLCESLKEALPPPSPPPAQEVAAPDPSSTAPVGQGV